MYVYVYILIWKNAKIIYTQMYALRSKTYALLTSFMNQELLEYNVRATRYDVI